MASLLPVAADGSLRVLDVGGGYGVFSAEVLDLHPHAVVVLHDYSVPMIGQARRRLSRFAGRMDYQMADMAADGCGRFTLMMSLDWQLGDRPLATTVN